MTALAITADERDEYFAFVVAQAKKTIHPEATTPAELYHYTSGEGLVGIIESGDLWATQVSCLNDATEVRYAEAALREAFLLYLRDPSLDSDATLICERAIAALSVDGAPTSEWFVACLSQEADDLSQWRAYGRGEGGYAIGFDATRLHEAVRAAGSYIVEVCYDPAVHIDITHSVAVETVRLFKKGLAARSGVDREDWAKAFLLEWRDALTHLVPMIKHHKFAAEREWRIIRGLREGDRHKLKFRQRQSMLARHLPLALRFPETSTAPLLPISSVWVGPSRHQLTSKISVTDLLRAKGYPQAVYDNVRVSAVPFQAF